MSAERGEASVHRPGPPAGAPIACAAAVVAIALLLALPRAAVAQAAPPERPSALGATTIPAPPARIEAPPMIIGAPATEISLGIAVARNGAAPGSTYVRIRGLTPQMALSEGHVIAPGSWAVPVAALPDLRVLIPAGAAGRSEIAVALLAIDGGVLAEAKTTLVVAPAALAPQPAAVPDVKPPSAPQLTDDNVPPRTLVPRAVPAPPSAAPLPVAPAPRTSPPVVASLPPNSGPEATLERRESATASPLSTAARERGGAMLARGRKLLEGGDFASARLFFRRAADEGLADGAIALGSTFDPSELPGLKAIGIKPDPAEARRWYEKARELGAGAAADQRIQRLGSAR